MVYQPSPESDPPISYFELNRQYELVRSRISPTMDVATLIAELMDQGQSKAGAESILWNLTETKLPIWRRSAINWLSSLAGIALIVISITGALANIAAHPLAPLTLAICLLFPLRGVYLWLRLRRICTLLHDAKLAKERRRSGA